MQALQRWSKETGGTLIASLLQVCRRVASSGSLLLLLLTGVSLQPIPEIMALFDNIVLLQEGYVVYRGTSEGTARCICETRVEPSHSQFILLYCSQALRHSWSRRRA